MTSDWSALANITALVTQDHAEKMKALLGYNYPERERERVLELGAQNIKL